MLAMIKWDKRLEIRKPLEYWCSLNEILRKNRISLADHNGHHLSEDRLRDFAWYAIQSQMMKENLILVDEHNNALSSEQVNAIVGIYYDVTCAEVSIDSTVHNCISETCKLYAESKKEEEHHKKDHKSDAKTGRRFETGQIGHMLVDLLLGVKTIDQTIGHSHTYNKPDLFHAGLTIGVKTAQMKFLFPMVHLTETYPEIMVLLDEDDLLKGYVLGVVGVQDMWKWMSRMMIHNCVANKEKAGFGGFHLCRPFPGGITDLKMLDGGKWRTDV